MPLAITLMVEADLHVGRTLQPFSLRPPEVLLCPPILMRSVLSYPNIALIASASGPKSANVIQGDAVTKP
jgi:hypothetical protein